MYKHRNWFAFSALLSGSFFLFGTSANSTDFTSYLVAQSSGEYNVDEGLDATSSVSSQQADDLALIVRERIIAPLRTGEALSVKIRKPSLLQNTFLADYTACGRTWNPQKSIVINARIDLTEEYKTQLLQTLDSIATSVSKSEVDENYRADNCWDKTSCVALVANENKGSGDYVGSDWKLTKFWKLNSDVLRADKRPEIFENTFISDYMTFPNFSPVLEIFDSSDTALISERLFSGEMNRAASSGAICSVEAIKMADGAIASTDGGTSVGVPLNFAKDNGVNMIAINSGLELFIFVDTENLRVDEIKKIRLKYAD